MAQQPYQQRPQQQRQPQYQQPYQPQQQYPQQQYGQQQYPQGGQSAYLRPPKNATAWILGIMCIVFFVGFIIMMIMYLNSNPQAQEQVTRANKAEAALRTKEAEFTSLKNMTGAGSGDIGKEGVERLLSAEKKRADTYWKALSTEKQDEFKNSELHIDDFKVERDGSVAHLILTNGHDKALNNVQVRIIFWNGDVIGYAQQPDTIPLVPARSVKKQYDFPINRTGLNPAWKPDVDIESGGTSKVKIKE